MPANDASAPAELGTTLFLTRAPRSHIARIWSAAKRA
jgi:hypothetical protein